MNPYAHAVVTQKLHGTSIRIGHVPVARHLPWWERIICRLGVKVQESEWAYVYGSRKVVKDMTNPNQKHFYGDDLYTEEGRKLDGMIPRGYVVYGELIGWVSMTTPIQKNYTYDLLPGTRRLYVYRVSTINEQGLVCDLSWEALKQFCGTLGLNHVPELWSGLLQEFTPHLFLDRRLYEAYPQAVPLVPESPCDEGVCIRVEGIIPQIVKAKSPVFLGHETKMLDQGVEDLESAQTEVEEVLVA